MRVLDMDLDFFLNGISRYSGSPDRRLGAGDILPWGEGEVRDFIENRLGLSADKRVPAIRVVNHDEVIDHLWQMQGGVCTEAPMWDVVHVDAHADLGFGDLAPMRVEGLARRPIEDRSIDFSPDALRAPGEGGELDEGNYLLYMMLLRMLRGLEYVCHDGTRGVEDADNTDWGDVHPRTKLRRQGCLRIAAPGEPPVDFKSIGENSYSNSEPFDIAFLAESPSYTPESADALLDVIGDYLDYDRGDELYRACCQGIREEEK